MRMIASVCLVGLLLGLTTGCIELVDDPPYIVDVDTVMPELIDYLNQRYAAQTQGVMPQPWMAHDPAEASSPVSAQVVDSVPLIGVNQLHRIGVRGQNTAVMVLDYFATPLSDGAVITHGEIVSDIIWAAAPEALIQQVHVEYIAEFLDARYPSLAQAIQEYDPTGTELIRVVVGLGLGLALVINEQSEPGLAAVNLSLGTGQEDASGVGLYDQVCPNLSPNRWIDQFIQTLNAEGVMVVAASGNEGQAGGYGREGWPACDPGIVSVAATWDTYDLPMGTHCREAAVDTLTCYSNRASFTDLAAPGSNIVTDSTVLQAFFDLLGNTAVSLLNQEGTSWAAPHVAGAAALLRSGVGPVSPRVLRHVFRSTGHPVFDPITGITIARIHVPTAYVQLLRQ